MYVNMEQLLSSPPPSSESDDRTLNTFTLTLIMFYV